MPTITAAVAALKRHAGFNSTRATNIARRLQDDGLLPKGTPSEPPQIDELQFAHLFLALASDTNIADAPNNVRRLLATTPGGVSLAGAPASIGTARSALLALVETAIDHPGDLDGFRIEVVSSWPEIALFQFGKCVGRYQPVGSLNDHWQAPGHRKSTTVDGRAFRDAARSTFKGAH